MGKPIGYFFMACAGLTLLFLISDLVWMRRTGLMLMPFGQDLTAAMLGLYGGSFISLMLFAWIAFALNDLRDGQQEILDRITGRSTTSSSIRPEPRLHRDLVA